MTVNDTISTLLDMVSLEILGASHPFTAEILADRVLSFHFSNILLPDSASDFLGSQGFVSFRLKPVNGLPVLTLIPNAADIYFDFNDPIRTNTAGSITEMTVGINESSGGMSLHPNPVRDLLFAELPEGSQTVEILSMDGRVQYQASSRSSTLRIDTSSLPAGAYALRTIGTNKDGKTVYYTRNNFLNGKKGKDADKTTLLKIYKATLDGDNWTDVVELPFNSNDYNVAHPALSAA